MFNLTFVSVLGSFGGPVGDDVPWETRCPGAREPGVQLAPSSCRPRPPAPGLGSALVPLGQQWVTALHVLVYGSFGPGEVPESRKSGGVIVMAADGVSGGCMPVSRRWGAF